MANADKEKKSKTISVILPMDMVSALEDKMREEERNMSYIIRKAIQEYLNKEN